MIQPCRQQHPGLVAPFCRFLEHGILSLCYLSPQHKTSATMQKHFTI